MRKAQVDNLKAAGHNVIVVLPNYKSNYLEKKEEGILLIPYKTNERITYLLHSNGLLSCYLNRWVKNTINYLKKVIKKEDVVFATTGGEMGTLIIASELKRIINCKTIFNYHDPIKDTSVFDLFPTSKTSKINKNKIEGKYLENIDLILTSSELNRQALLEKYSNISADKVKTIYFGYLKSLYSKELKKDSSQNKIRIVYGGSFARLQKPELLIEAAIGLKNIEVVYIGNHQNYDPIQKYKNDCLLLPAMPYVEYVKYIQEKADIGFVSLSDEYYGACIPSKLYEYINVGLPILGALPEGDAMNIINDKNYGLACHFSDLKKLKENLIKLTQVKIANQCEINILANRENWSMNHNFNKVLALI